jgi:hypothetical protein
MDGFFDFGSAADLLKKLEADFTALQYDQRNSCAAYNFFVSAESMLDWLHPGNAGKSQREVERNREVLLQVVSHLATKAKHFRPEAKCHQSVSDTRKVGGTFGANSFRARTFAAHSFSKGSLFIDLDGKAVKRLGDSISAVALAKLVLEYWQCRISKLES